MHNIPDANFPSHPARGWSQRQLCAAYVPAAWPGEEGFMKKKFDGFSCKLARRLRMASYLLKREAMMIEREAKDGKDADGVRDDIRSYITPDEDED